MITRIDCGAEQTERLLSMGVTEGAKVTLVRFAPLGDPLEIEVRDYRLAVRKALAEAVEVKKIER